MVNYSQRYFNRLCLIKQRIAAGEIGKPLMAMSIKYDTIYVPTGMIPSWASETSPIYFDVESRSGFGALVCGVDPVEVLAHETRGVLAARVSARMTASMR